MTAASTARNGLSGAVAVDRVTRARAALNRRQLAILDMVAVYLHLLDHDVPSGCYNAGFENLSLLAIADRVRAQLPAEVVVTGSNDPRSYRLNSDKLLSTGFVPRHSIDDAIREITEAVAEGSLKEDDRWHNVRWMKTVLAT